jgi:hypothetical protein
MVRQRQCLAGLLSGALAACSVMILGSQVDASIIVSTNPNAVYSASGVYDPIAYAFDGNPVTHWNAPAYAPQWIKVDLGDTYSLTAFDLLTSQLPNGNTTHEVLVDDVLVHVFSGYTTDNQWLQFVPVTPINGRYVEILTTSSPSWVGWSEVQVSGDGPTSAVPEPSTLAIFSGLGGLAFVLGMLRRAKAAVFRRGAIASLLMCSVVLGHTESIRAGSGNENNPGLAPTPVGSAAPISDARGLDGSSETSFDLGNGSTMVIDPSQRGGLRLADSAAQVEVAPQISVTVPSKNLHIDDSMLLRDGIPIGIMPPSRPSDRVGGPGDGSVSYILRSTLMGSGLAIAFVILAFAARSNKHRQGP